MTWAVEAAHRRHRFEDNPRWCAEERDFYWYSPVLKRQLTR
jgi:hypothetical protein